MSNQTNVQKKALFACMKARMPVVMIGAPGVGKTSMMREMADRLGYELIVVVGSQMDSTDVAGIPRVDNYFDEDTEINYMFTDYAMPWWQMKIIRNKKIVLFLDEMSNTSPSVQASMLMLIQDREFANGTKMPPETIVVGAMNPTEQAADGYELSEPTTNRICFIPWTPTIKEWKEGMLRGFGKKISEDELRWKQLIVRFIDDNPSFLQRESSDELGTPSVYNITTPSEEEVFRYAWTSRRSWDNLSRVLASADDSVETQNVLAQGIVGFSAAAEFRKWLSRNENELSPRDVLDNPAQDWKRMSPDLRATILREIVGMSGESRETSEQAIAVFAEIANQGVESFGGPYMRDLLKNVKRAPHGKEVQSQLMGLAKSYSKIARNNN